MEEKIREQWSHFRQDDEEIEIDLLELAGQLLKNWKWIFLTVVLGAVAAGLYSYYLLVPAYTATSKLYMVSSSEGSLVNFTELNIGTSLASDYSELIRIRDVADEVIDTLSLDYSYEEIEGMLTVENVPNTRVLKISVVNPNPEEAMQIANMVAEAAQRILPERTDALKPKIVEYAVLPRAKSSPNNLRNAIMGGLIGFFLSAGLFTLLYIMDNTLHTEEDFERIFNMQPLAIVPEGDIASVSDAAEQRDRRRRRRQAREKKRHPADAV